MQEFGYVDTDEERPLIRLSCQAQAFGAVSLVNPPWNGILGKFLREERSRSRSRVAEGDREAPR
jgi:hypothetical protein